MARFGHENGKVVWLNPERGRGEDMPATVGGVAALFIFLSAICLTAELLARAIAAWIGREQNVALSFISTSGFL